MAETVATRYAGTRVQRVEDTRLLTGHGTFVDDITRPGMLHACFVRSPFARARINGIDASAAVALPGVARCFTAADLNPDVKEAWHAVVGKDIPDTPRPPMAEARRSSSATSSRSSSPRAAISPRTQSMVDVDYEPLPAIADFTKAVGSYVAVHEAYPDNVAVGLAGAPPDEDTFSAAAHVVSEIIYQVPNTRDSGPNDQPATMTSTPMSMPPGRWRYAARHAVI